MYSETSVSAAAEGSVSAFAETEWLTLHCQVEPFPSAEGTADTPD